MRQWDFEKLVVAGNWEDLAELCVQMRKGTAALPSLDVLEKLLLRTESNMQLVGWLCEIVSLIKVPIPVFSKEFTLAITSSVTYSTVLSLILCLCYSVLNKELALENAIQKGLLSPVRILCDMGVLLNMPSHRKLVRAWILNPVPEVIDYLQTKGLRFLHLPSEFYISNSPIVWKVLQEHREMYKEACFRPLKRTRAALAIDLDEVKTVVTTSSSSSPSSTEESDSDGSDFDGSEGGVEKKIPKVENQVILNDR